MGRFDCSFPGCQKGVSYGGEAIYRTNPKGQPFEGRCEEHLDEPPDPEIKRIVDAVRDDNC